MKMSDCQMGRHKWQSYKCRECGELAPKYEMLAADFTLNKLIEQIGRDFGKRTFIMSRGTYEIFRKLVFEKSEETLLPGGPAEFLGCTVTVADDIITKHGKAVYFLLPIIEKNP